MCRLWVMRISISTATLDRIKTFRTILNSHAWCWLMRIGAGFSSELIMAQFSSSAQSWAPSGSAWMGQPWADTGPASFTVKNMGKAHQHCDTVSKPQYQLWEGSGGYWERGWAELFEKKTLKLFLC